MTSTSFRQTITAPLICERTTTLLQLQLTDENDEAIAKASLSTLTLTLYERKTATILNGRDQSDILDDNGGTVSSTGLLDLILDDNDNALATQASKVAEDHVALIEWTWSSGTRFGKKEITFTVANQRIVV